MESTHELEERRRLQALYAGMSDGEIVSLVSEIDTLTDVAKPLLQAEFSSRNLSLTPEVPNQETDPFDPSELDLLVLQRVWDAAEARRVKEILDTVRIPSYVGPDYLEDLDALPQDLEGGMDLWVRREDQQRALTTLRLARAAEPDPEPSPEYAAFCPECHSPEIVFLALDSELADDATVPAQADASSEAKFNWACDACGHEWKDDGFGEVER
jgi:hypothetical protein